MKQDERGRPGQKAVTELLTKLGASLPYKTARSGLWPVERPSGAVVPIRIYLHQEGIWRLAVGDGCGGCFDLPREVRSDIADRLEAWHLEISMLPEETETVTAWTLAHLDSPVTTLPDWVAPRWAYNVVLGERAQRYFWTKRAHDAAEALEGRRRWQGARSTGARSRGTRDRDLPAARAPR